MSTINQNNSSRLIHRSDMGKWNRTASRRAHRSSSAVRQREARAANERFESHHAPPPAAARIPPERAVNYERLLGDSAAQSTRVEHLASEDAPCACKRGNRIKEPPRRAAQRSAITESERHVLNVLVRVSVYSNSRQTQNQNRKSKSVHAIQNRSRD